uniref:Uncharacterized protein n=1 Tax=Anthoceros angustus TaxID=48387 RepID=A0A2P1L4W0_ANTAG|nr:hypothetical protein AnanMp55 [Anthoceros angustus]AVP12845.1 hypothetical protein AnanMp55 [Anthoceros angustus]
MLDKHPSTVCLCAPHFPHFWNSHQRRPHFVRIVVKGKLLAGLRWAVVIVARPPWRAASKNDEAKIKRKPEQRREKERQYDVTQSEVDGKSLIWNERVRIADWRWKDAENHQPEWVPHRDEPGKDDSDKG